MKKNLKSVIVLTVICLVVSVLLAAVNYFTAPIIAESENKAANASLAIVMPDGGTFEEVDITAFELPETVQAAYSASNGGHVIRLSATGYSTDMIIMCGVNGEGVVTGATCISSNETLGVEKTYGESFTNVAGADVESVDTVASATLTSTAYRNAVKDAVNANIILSGGSVDIRSDDQILMDNLSAALPEAEGLFTEVFIAEEIDPQITKIYAADNASGYVVKLGENFVSVADGKAINSTDESLNAISVEAVDLVSKTTLTEITDLGDDAPKAIDAVYMTESGNYVFELKASGYGIKAEYGANGEYIHIKLSMTADGVIISCVTTAQAETENIGDACAKESYYTQYNGKNSETYKDVETIAGASEYTAPAYKGAVRQAFEMFEILKGGLE